MENKVVYDSSMNMANETISFASRILAALLNLLQKNARDGKERDAIEKLKEHTGQFLVFPGSDEFMERANEEGLLCVRFTNEGKDYILFRDSDINIAQNIANSCKTNDMDYELSPSDFLDAANDEKLIIINGFKDKDDIDAFRSAAMESTRENLFNYTTVYYDNECAVIAYEKDIDKIKTIIDDPNRIHDFTDKDYANICVQDIDVKVDIADKEIKKDTKEKDKSLER